MSEKNKYISYAMDFASYAIEKLENIDRIIIHGSIARGDFDEESDIDLFIDTKEKNAENKIKKILEDYYKTSKFKQWELKGINNPLSIISGNLDSEEWKDLKRAMINTGIILYGKYTEKIEKTNQYVLFSFENIKPDKKRISFYRKLFGFTLNKKHYSGIAEKIQAFKLGKGCLLVPIAKANELKQFFQNNKITVKLYDFWSDVKFS